VLLRAPLGVILLGLLPCPHARAEWVLRASAGLRRVRWRYCGQSWVRTWCRR